MNGMIRKLTTAIGIGALMMAIMLSVGGHIGIQSASAQTISTSTDGWTRENFASSCKAAGGHLIEIDSPGIKYSKCVFPSGTNKCDWIKKICTFGLEAQPTGGRFDANIVNGGVLDASATDSGSGGATTNAGTTRVVKSGTLDRKGD